MTTGIEKSREVNMDEEISKNKKIKGEGALTNKGMKKLGVSRKCAGSLAKGSKLLKDKKDGDDSDDSDNNSSSSGSGDGSDKTPGANSDSGSGSESSSSSSSGSSKSEDKEADEVVAAVETPRSSGRKGHGKNGDYIFAMKR